MLHMVKNGSGGHMLETTNVNSKELNIKWKQFFSQQTQVIVVLVVLLCSLIFFIGNALRLNDVLLGVTQNYVKDVSYRLTNDVVTHLNGDLISCELIADSIPTIGDGNATDAQKQDYLNRKADILGLNCLAVINADGTATKASSCVSDAIEQESVRAAFQGNSGVSYVKGHSLLYTVPIYRGGQVDAVLVGERDQANMQELIRPTSFKGNGLSCIIDKTGSLIIAPTDKRPFNELQEVMGGAQKQGAINKVKQDIENNQSGVIHFKATTGESVIMAYQMMGISDWVMLVLVPANLVTEETNAYILRTVLSTLLVVSLLLALVLMTRRFYANYNEKLERIAFVDPLTGGPNKAAFQENYRILAQKIQPMEYAVVVFNIRSFKLINERFGQEAGDRTLRYVYKVLKQNLAEDEFVSRSESDYFFLCLHESEPEHILMRLHNMEQDINAFNQDSTHPYLFAFFQGVYIVDDLSLSGAVVQGRARIACRNQRASGQPGCGFYKSGLTKKLQMEQELSSLFEESLHHDNFKVYLQPKVRLSDNQLVGAEALVRWQHPERGLIPPDDFIPLLEQSTKICELDLYVFEKVCALQEMWYEQGKELFPISTNLSRKHFNDSNFLQPFIAVAEKYNIPPDFIEFEVTESIFFNEESIAYVRHGIQQMHEHGFLCSLDDFGSGFSSLGMLDSFDVDALKLDRSFFVDMHSEKTRSIIACLLELANKLQIQTIAEGIETTEQLEYLRQMNCDIVQGYVFSKPLPVEAFEQWQKNR